MELHTFVRIVAGALIWELHMHNGVLLTRDCCVAHPDQHSCSHTDHELAHTYRIVPQTRLSGLHTRDDYQAVGQDSELAHTYRIVPQTRLWGLCTRYDYQAVGQGTREALHRLSN